MHTLRLVYVAAGGRKKILSEKHCADPYERARAIEKMRREARVWHDLDFPETVITEDGQLVH